jgi:DNA-binding protein Fis
MVKHSASTSDATEAEADRRIQQLVLLAQALVSELETLQAELSSEPIIVYDKEFNLAKEGIDFYQEIERYEIELIRSALDYCAGNQTRAARLLHMKNTTLNAKMKHYGLT